MTKHNLSHTNWLLLLLLELDEEAAAATGGTTASSSSSLSLLVLASSSSLSSSFLLVGAADVALRVRLRPVELLLLPCFLFLAVLSTMVLRWCWTSDSKCSLPRLSSMTARLHASLLLLLAGSMMRVKRMSKTRGAMCSDSLSSGWSRSKSSCLTLALVLSVTMRKALSTSVPMMSAALSSSSRHACSKLRITIQSKRYDEVYIGLEELDGNIPERS